MFDTVTKELQGADQDSMLGAQYLKHKVFSFERRRREAMLGGGGVRGHAPPKMFWKKLYNLVHSRAHLSLKILLFWGFFLFVFLIVAFEDKSENKEKEQP